MQTSDRVAARRYAKAFFETAKPEESGRLRRDLAAALKGLRPQNAALRHPLLPLAEKAKLLHKALGDQVGSGTLRFLEILLKRKRFDLLSVIAGEFEKIADSETRVARAHVRVAKPLGDAEKAGLEKALSKYLGKSIVMDVKEDPALIAGIIVKVGDQVLDASAARQLQRLKEKIAGS